MQVISQCVQFCSFHMHGTIYIQDKIYFASKPDQTMISSQMVYTPLKTALRPVKALMIAIVIAFLFNWALPVSSHVSANEISLSTAS